MTENNDMTDNNKEAAAQPEVVKFWKTDPEHDVQKIFSDAALLWAEADKYFTYCVNNPLCEPSRKSLSVHTFSLQGFCLYVGCDTDQFDELRSRVNFRPNELSDADKKLRSVVQRIEDAIYEHRYIYAAAGLLKGPFVSKDLRLGEKKEKKVKMFRFVD